ncbi:MAG: Ig-like domain-containing protein, partial [candidate division KSB1 bacterium]|nr:Ig-like domain-containing protein [candidate division KSB1 bacterium]
MGINKFDLFKQYQGTPMGAYAGSAYQKVSRAMAKKAIVDAANAGITYFRVSVTGFQPAAYGEPGDLDLWMRDPQAHWALFDELMADLNAAGVRLVPVFVWNVLQFPAMSGNETIADLIADSTSWSYQTLIRYISEFIQRYRDNPTVYFYELSNELNDHADINLFEVWCDGKSPCGAVATFSTDELIAFTGRLARFIRSLDSTRLISSGFNLPRRAAAHLRRQPAWSSDGPDWTPDSKEEFIQHLAEIHADMDIISIHFYNSVEDTLYPDTRRSNVRWGLSGATNVELLDVVKQIADSLNKLLFVGEFADADPPILYDRTAPFSQNVLNKIVELRIPFSAPWVWQFYKYQPYLFTEFSIEPGYTDFFIEKIKEANRQLGNSVPEPTEPDTTPPQVVLVWPLEHAVLDSITLVAAVASDDHAVASVSFLVDGNVVQTIHAPPYAFLFDPTGLTPGTHVLQAVAQDTANNQATYATIVDRPNVTSIGQQSTARQPPRSFASARKFVPNPFNPTTIIAFDLPESHFVTLSIYNMLGQEVARPVSERLPAGRYTVRFDTGRLPGGVYLYRIEAGPFH